MAVLQVSGVADLIASTQSDLGPMKVTDLTRDVQTFRWFNRLFKKSQLRFDGGASIKINVLTDVSQNSRWVGLYELDPDMNNDDALTTGDCPWRFSDYYWLYDTKEMDINRGQYVIQDYVKMKRYRAFLGWATFQEAHGWASPPSVTDTKKAFNLRYWLTKNVTASGIGSGVAGDGSFSGAAPSGHTTVGGINPSTYTRWKNYTYKYTDATEADLLTRLRTMAMYIDFEPPDGLSYPQHAGVPSHEHLIGMDPLQDLIRLAEGRNDNLGFDFAARTISFARAPFTYIRQLDDDSDNPIYSMDWGATNTCILRDKWQVPSEAIRSHKAHSVWINWIESAFQLVMWDRRRFAVGSKSANND